MIGNKSNPPRLALWLLRCGGDSDALTGDLIEKFHEGRTRRWFWKQVLVAFALSILAKIRQHWPQFSYAIAGTEMPRFLGRTVHEAVAVIHWHAYPWSILLLEWRDSAILALAALPVLATALLISGTFRWLSILRTGMITWALIGLGHFMPDMFPWLLRPVEGSHGYLKESIFPPVFLMLVFFCTFLASAWLGCASRTRRATTEVNSKTII